MGQTLQTAKEEQEAFRQRLAMRRLCAAIYKQAMKEYYGYDAIRDQRSTTERAEQHRS